MDVTEVNKDGATSDNSKLSSTSGDIQKTSAAATATPKPHLHFQLYIESSESRLQRQNHLQRLQKLRKNLNHIKETEWQYEPIEKHIGQL